jgi:hypothetical protein
MSIYSGLNKIKKLYVGETKLRSVYKGTQLIWENEEPVSSLSTGDILYVPLQAGGHLPSRIIAKTSSEITLFVVDNNHFNSHNPPSFDYNTGTNPYSQSNFYYGGTYLQNYIENTCYAALKTTLKNACISKSVTVKQFIYSGAGLGYDTLTPTNWSWFNSKALTTKACPLSTDEVRNIYTQSLLRLYPITGRNSDTWLRDTLYATVKRDFGDGQQFNVDVAAWYGIEGLNDSWHDGTLIDAVYDGGAGYKPTPTFRIIIPGNTGLGYTTDLNGKRYLSI